MKKIWPFIAYLIVAPIALLGLVGAILVSPIFIFFLALEEVAPQDSFRGD